MGHGAILNGFSQYFLNVPHFLEGKILAKYTVALRKGGMGGGGGNRNTRQDPQILAKYTVALRKGGMGGGGGNRNTRQDPQILAKYTVAKKWVTEPF